MWLVKEYGHQILLRDNRIGGRSLVRVRQRVREYRGLSGSRSFNQVLKFRHVPGQELRGEGIQRPRNLLCACPRAGQKPAKCEDTIVDIRWRSRSGGSTTGNTLRTVVKVMAETVPLDHPADREGRPATSEVDAVGPTAARAQQLLILTGPEAARL